MSRNKRSLEHSMTLLTAAFLILKIHNIGTCKTLWLPWRCACFIAVRTSRRWLSAFSWSTVKAISFLAWYHTISLTLGSHEVPEVLFSAKSSPHRHTGIKQQYCRHLCAELQCWCNTATNFWYHTHVRWHSSAEKHCICPLGFENANHFLTQRSSRDRQGASKNDRKAYSWAGGKQWEDRIDHRQAQVSEQAYLSLRLYNFWNPHTCSSKLWIKLTGTCLLSLLESLQSSFGIEAKTKPLEDAQI